MGFSKDIQVGPVTVTVSESAGVASLKVVGSQSVGGGQAAGILTAKLAVEIDMGAQQGADLALALIEAHLPSLKALIDATVKPAIDAELAKI